MSANHSSSPAGDNAGDLSAKPAPMSQPEATATDVAAARSLWQRSLDRPTRLLLAVLGVVVVWFCIETRLELSGLREDVALRFKDTSSDSKEARTAARLAQEAVHEAQAKLAQIETRVQEAQSQQLALETLYQELSRSRDEWVVAETEQILSMASQQLQLAGNVQAALVALQTADARLARSDRPQFLPLRKALSRDIERLKLVPNIDVNGIALRIDQAIAAVDSLPLAYEARPVVSDSPTPPPAQTGFWQRLIDELVNEMRQLVRIQQVDRVDAAVLAPGQAYFLRENLKLRLLNARLALLSRNDASYREDMRIAQAWTERYFDSRARAVTVFATGLKTLAGSAVASELPSVADSLSAVRSFKLAREMPTR